MSLTVQRGTKMGKVQILLPILYRTQIYLFSQSSSLEMFKDSLLPLAMFSLKPDTFF